MPESVSSPRWVKHRIKTKAGTKGAMGDPLETGITNRHFENDLAQWQDCPGCEKCLPNDGLVLRHGSWRPTESHEFILMLTKSNDYYADGEAVREKQLPQSIARMTRNHLTDYDPGYPTQGPQNLHYGEKLSQEEAGNMSGRNLRSVWTFSTQSYAGAHYATFPEKLPELCIKAGTPEYGVCAECGKPYARILERSKEDVHRRNYKSEYAREPLKEGKVSHLEENYRVETQTLGWKKTCKCQTDKVVGATVLDPFSGTATTLAVAKRLGRQAVGYEMSEEYCSLSVKRLEQVTSPMRLVGG